MNELDLRTLGGVNDALYRLSDTIRAEKEKLLDQLGTMALQKVSDKIKSNKFSDGGVKLVGWQKYYVGSKLGYVAVRPVGEHDGYTNGKNSPGAITIYNDAGHSIRKRKSATSRYRPRIKVAQATGKHFYGRSMYAVSEEAAKILEDYAKRMEQELEGLT